jgi:hypothetical protein
VWLTCGRAGGRGRRSGEPFFLGCLMLSDGGQSGQRRPEVREGSLALWPLGDFAEISVRVWPRVRALRATTCAMFWLRSQEGAS